MKHLELDMKEEMKEDLLDFRKQMRKMMKDGDMDMDPSSFGM